MATSPKLAGRVLATKPDRKSGRETEGFLTPKADRVPQVFNIPARRVIPIVFLPGIMGSNLRMSADRQRFLKRENNIAWRPDNTGHALSAARFSAALRQLLLDPESTEVDTYDPVANLSGDSNETSDERNSAVTANFDYGLWRADGAPLLMDDPPSVSPRKGRDRKARERGWGEVFFSSYQSLLVDCEKLLNAPYSNGQLKREWTKIIDVAPAEWQAHPSYKLKPLSEMVLKSVVTNCWYPVHAMGYNWLRSNRESGIVIAKRIEQLIQQYKQQHFQCEKVIVVTHSMGGLVARALIHPKMGNAKHLVLGMVHGVMPAIGAGAAYKRMRCGFEDPGLASASPIVSVTSKVLGNFGSEVTAVLGNSPGGLQLLPSKAYGLNWLRVMHGERTVLSLPRFGDPYEEIYKLKNTWYGLIREQWLNPARKFDHSGFKDTSVLLDEARAFHDEIESTYHEHSFAHYGADPERVAWHNVVWSIDAKSKYRDFKLLDLISDTQQGRLGLTDLTFPSRPGEHGPLLPTTMMAATDAGDETVPLHSADHQLLSGKFQGIFRQTGYEHQSSYSDSGALRSTLYSLVRIAETMVWGRR